eukprot:14753784-Alexandrium_andersonii.AAC.1
MYHKYSRGGVEASAAAGAAPTGASIIAARLAGGPGLEDELGLGADADDGRGGQEVAPEGVPHAWGVARRAAKQPPIG